MPTLIYVHRVQLQDKPSNEEVRWRDPWDITKPIRNVCMGHLGWPCSTVAPSFHRKAAELSWAWCHPVPLGFFTSGIWATMLSPALEQVTSSWCRSLPHRTGIPGWLPLKRDVPDTCIAVPDMITLWLLLTRVAKKTCFLCHLHQNSFHNLPFALEQHRA